MMQYLAIDYGTRKSGLAYCVEWFSFAWKTIKSHDLLREVRTAIDQKNIQAIVVGMPYNIDGSMSSHGRRVWTVVKYLKKNINLPIVTHDERLTTSEARISFAESGYDGDIDAESARLILQDYLESIEKRDL